MELWAEVGKTALAAVFSLAVLLVLTKLMGVKQVSQMTMFDYVVGITIGSIAAEMATEVSQTVASLTAMALYGGIAWGLSKLTERSLRARSVAVGKPKVLLDDGAIHRENLKRANMDMSEFMVCCRMQGYFDLGQIQTAVLEPNGAVSILPKESARPATPQDLELRPKQARMPMPFVMDGVLLKENIHNAGKEESWVHRTLLKQGYRSEKEVLLALWSGGEQMTIFPDGSEPKGA